MPEAMQPHRFIRHIDSPTYFTPALADAMQEYRDSIPDIILLKHDDANAGWEFTIVELKYCRDTDPTPQQERAVEQHAALKDLILADEDRATVNIVTLMLGASGVIYESFERDMRVWLGVRGSALTSLARRLHFIVVRNLQLMWAQRSAMLENSIKRPRPKGKRGKKHTPRNTQHAKPTQRSQQHNSRKGTKRPHAGSVPDHRKRRKKR
jgi:hypothetical protein